MAVEGRARNFSLPLGQTARNEKELELAKLLASGRHIAGAILFSSKRDKFEYVKSEGDLERPLHLQCDFLRVHDRELGELRQKCFFLHYVQSDTGYFSKIFTRVLSGNF